MRPWRYRSPSSLCSRKKLSSCRFDLNDAAVMIPFAGVRRGRPLHHSHEVRKPAMGLARHTDSLLSARLWDGTDAKDKSDAFAGANDEDLQKWADGMIFDLDLDEEMQARARQLLPPPPPLQ